MSIEKPQQRKGFVITSVQWNRAGRVVATKYERMAAQTTGERILAATQAVTPIVRRSMLAAEQGSLL